MVGRYTGTQVGTGILRTGSTWYQFKLSVYYYRYYPVPLPIHLIPTELHGIKKKKYYYPRKVQHFNKTQKYVN